MADSSPQLIFKRGDSFIYPFVVWATSKKDVPLDVTNITFKAQIRKGETLIVDLSFVKSDAVNGRVIMQYSGSTEAWPTSNLVCDIEMTDTASNQKISTNTFIIRVEKDITRSGA